MDIRITNATIDHLPHIMDIQRAVYPENLVESAQVFESILSFGLSLVALDDNGSVIGFLVAHPSIRNHIYMLHEPLNHDAHTPIDTLFIHDCSIHPAFHKRNVGSSLVGAFLSMVSYVDAVQLVSVNGSRGFWEKQGFRCTDGVVMSKEAAASYGGGLCVHMSR